GLEPDDGIPPRRGRTPPAPVRGEGPGTCRATRRPAVTGLLIACGCAAPGLTLVSLGPARRRLRAVPRPGRGRTADGTRAGGGTSGRTATAGRSEERRVGKQCSGRATPATMLPWDECPELTQATN